mmetsp:Transcript_23104/g.26488  ORF Transcript_23104/g.26488 Transcript_23104/m.26488 type:complete len:116 (-) Transcript_23104:188-535(-)
MLCESTGEFSSFIPSSPVNECNIISISSFTRGFIVGGEDGRFFIFEKTEDLDCPFKRMTETTYKDPNNKSDITITSIAITNSEDVVYFTLENNQLMKMSIALDGTDENPKYEQLI